MAEKRADAELSFEQALARLEELVGRLEGGELSLEESLETFERGTALVRRCARQLEAAELRIVQLEQGPDGPRERPLAVEERE